MTFHSPDLQASGRMLSEVERIRALVMNIHGMLRRTEAAHLAELPIENIHRSLDRIEEAARRQVQANCTALPLSLHHD